MQTNLSAATDSEDRLIPDREVAAFFSVVTRTIQRWDDDRDLNFPPAVVINGRRYRSLARLKTWAFERAAGKAA